MKNSFKYFIKHLKFKLYINPKNHNYNPKKFIKFGRKKNKFKQHNSIITSIHNIC